MPRRAPGRSAQAASTREAELAALLRSGPLRGSSGLIADATGMGRPVVDLLRLGGLRRVPVVIHGGGQLTRDPVMAYLHVPERELVSGAQVLLQAGRFKFAAALPEVKTLVNELLSFEVKISEAGNDVSGAWREGAHGDLVFAVALTSWYAERFGRPPEPVRRVEVVVY